MARPDGHRWRGPRAVRALAVTRAAPAVSERAGFTLAQWERRFSESAHHLRAAADTLEELGRCCRLVERAVREGAAALPELLLRLGMLPDLTSLLASGGPAGSGPGEEAGEGGPAGAG